MTKSLRRHIGEKERLKGWVFRRFLKQSVTAPLWRSPRAESSTVGKRRPEKLDRRWLKDGCVGRQAMMTKRSGDGDDLCQQMTGGIPQRDTAKPPGVDICTPGRTAWTRSALAPAASAAGWGAAWWGRISTINGGTGGCRGGICPPPTHFS